MSISCPVLKRAVKPAVCTARSLGPRAEEAYKALSISQGTPCSHWAARCSHPEHGKGAASKEEKKEEKAEAGTKEKPAKGGKKKAAKGEAKEAGAKTAKKPAAKAKKAKAE